MDPGSIPGILSNQIKATNKKLFTVEIINNDNSQDTQKKFEAPKTKADFPEGQTKIEHEYENGNKVVFLLLTNGKVARIREGLGEDVEKANIESGGDRAQYLTSMMASTVTIDGNGVNMFELKQGKMKDYLNIQAAFAELNF